MLELTKKASLFKKVGVVVSVTDGIVKASGLLGVANGEMVSFCIGSKGERLVGLILNLEPNFAYAVVFGLDKLIRPGQYILRKCTLMNVPTGLSLLVVL